MFIYHDLMYSCLMLQQASCPVHSTKRNDEVSPAGLAQKAADCDVHLYPTGCVGPNKGGTFEALCRTRCACFICFAVLCMPSLHVGTHNSYKQPTTA